MSTIKRLSGAWREALFRLSAGLKPRTGDVVFVPGVRGPRPDDVRDLEVYLPASYAEGGRRYPVLYLQDGQNLFDDARSFAGAWHVAEAMGWAARQNLEAIVVGIPNLRDERSNEYSPFADLKAGGGRGDAYLDFVTRTVKPIIDSRFTTKPERESTGIGGSSLGALISLYGFLRAPAAFGVLAALSPALWFAGRAVFPFVEAAALVPGRVYLDVGKLEGEETVADARRLRDLLLAKGYRSGQDLLWVEDRRGRHHESDWGRRFRQALPFLLTS